MSVRELGEVVSGMVSATKVGWVGGFGVLLRSGSFNEHHPGSVLGGFGGFEISLANGYSCSTNVTCREV